MADDSERDDPVLVRPYITTQPAESVDRPAPTWPATADLPEEGTGEVPVAAPAPVTITDPAAKTIALRRQKLLVLAGIGVLALLGGAGLVLLRPADDGDQPVTTLPAPSAPGVTRSAGAAPVASAGTISASPVTSSTVNQSATATRNTATTGAAQGAPGPATTTTAASGAPTPTLSPPPGAARTGAIKAAGGRCLALGSLLGLEGAPVQTSGCADVSYQRWTLATDGTLLVTNRCAAVGTDAAVRIAACDDRPAAQWRAGSNGSLVNPQTGRCLTDPGALTVTVTVTDCTGAANQTWTLP